MSFLCLHGAVTHCAFAFLFTYFKTHLHLGIPLEHVSHLPIFLLGCLKKILSPLQRFPLLNTSSQRLCCHRWQAQPWPAASPAWSGGSVSEEPLMQPLSATRTPPHQPATHAQQEKLGEGSRRTVGDPRYDSNLSPQSTT